MKLQLEQQNLRVRMDEDELARLLQGSAVESRTQFAGAFELAVSIRLVDESLASVGGQAGSWLIAMPRAAVQALAAQLPSRDGLQFELTSASVAASLNLLFDVDVRDSARRLKASRTR